jgi:hypothetical protein
MWSVESDGNDTDGSGVELRDEKDPPRSTLMGSLSARISRTVRQLIS